MKKLWILIVACLLEFAPAFAFVNTAGAAAVASAANARRQREEREHEERYHDELNLIDCGVVSEGLVVQCVVTGKDDNGEKRVMYTVCERFHQEWLYSCKQHTAHYKSWEEFRRPATTDEITEYIKRKKAMNTVLIVFGIIEIVATGGLAIYGIKSDNW